MATDLQKKKKKRAFSPFPSVLSKGFFFRVIKRWDCDVPEATEFISERLENNEGIKDTAVYQHFLRRF